jgi:hypothetical protein
MVYGSNCGGGGLSALPLRRSACTVGRASRRDQQCNHYSFDVLRPHRYSGRCHGAHVCWLEDPSGGLSSPPTCAFGGGLGLAICASGFRNLLGF